MPDEEAFCLLVRLMHSYDLRGHFLPEMPKLQLHLVSIPVLMYLDYAYVSHIVSGSICDLTYKFKA